MEEVFEHAVFIPLLAILMEEEIGWEMIRVERGKEIGGEMRSLDDCQGVPKQLRVIEDVVGGGRLQSFKASGIVEIRPSETFRVCVAGSNERGRGVTMWWPLEFRKYRGDGGCSRKIDGVR